MLALFTALHTHTSSPMQQHIIVFCLEGNIEQKLRPSRDRRDIIFNPFFFFSFTMFQLLFTSKVFLLNMYVYTPPFNIVYVL